MIGVAIKLWSSEFDKASDEFKTSDSVVYLCHDIKTPDILYLSTVINHLVGDDSLDEVFNKHVPRVKDDVEEEEIVSAVMKEEEENRDEDYENNSVGEEKAENYSDSENDEEVKTLKIKRETDEDYEDNEDFNDYEDCEYEDEGQPKRKRPKRDLSNNYLLPKDLLPENHHREKTRTVHKNKGQGKWSFKSACKNCGLDSNDTTHFKFIEHLLECNPDQMSEIERRHIPKVLLPKGHKYQRERKEKSDKKWNVRMPRGTYSCDQCPAVFQNHSTFVKHLERHQLSKSSGNSETVYRCKICDLAFEQKGTFQSHMKRHEKAFQCDICQLKFSQEGSLKNHIISNHTTFPKDCKVCGQYCQTRAEFLKHMKSVHEKGEELPCAECGKLYPDKAAVTRHIYNAHKRKEKVKCEVCGKEFSGESYLQVHMSVHTGEYKFHCDECGKGFNKKKLLVACKNDHAGIFSFQCDKCDYKTNHENLFKAHYPIHSDVKSIICPLCGKTFTNIGRLGDHLRKVHKTTMLQAEIETRTSRFGVPMTDEDIEKTKEKFLKVSKISDTYKSR